MLYDLEIVMKQFTSEIIDIIICIFPSMLIYFFSDLETVISNLNIIHIFAFIYFLYGISLLFINEGRSFGDKIMNIQLINAKTGKRSSLLFLFKITIKSLIFLSLAEIQFYGFSMIILILIFPLKIKAKNNIYYSVMNLGCQATYIKK
jgi:hypothetical protein